MLKKMKSASLLRKQGIRGDSSVASGIASVQSTEEPHTSDEHDSNSHDPTNNVLITDQASQMRQLEMTQRKTLEVLSELNTAVRELRLAVNSNKNVPLVGTPQSPPDAVSDTESNLDPLEGFDRKQVRLDGLEVYAVVSAVTAGTLVSVFDSYHHCLFVFSLITMYGRTALGMERDDALEIFFAGTGLQRFHGFKTFVGSLYALMCELVVVITSKISSNPWLHLAALAVTTRLMYYVYNDTQIIMEKAGVIFAPPSQAIPPSPKVDDKCLEEEEEEENGEDGDDNKIKARNNAHKNTIKFKAAAKMVMLGKRGSAMNVPATALLGEDDSKNDSSDESKSPSVRRMGRNSVLNVAATALIEDPDADTTSSPGGVTRPAIQRLERRSINQSRRSLGTGGDARTILLKKHVSSMNFAATDLMDSN
eukprot:CAMPEP_0178681128 /NCGR_PEP_ID=MMETSP0699-20121125/1068_1 /TAXON_ID=265572 /ORGANISM="Extubocellulus spinifer, Strain CCMP396" /LENGTH=421 /DNA_ID=CAMNT_0020325561 /DNA_START=232 /DNA_END=1497 /DNA_ORIENTATION=-